MPAKCFTVLDMPVPHNKRAEATSAKYCSRTAAFGVRDKYQAETAWHQVTKAVAPHTLPTSAIMANCSASVKPKPPYCGETVAAKPPKLPNCCKNSAGYKPWSISATNGVKFFSICVLIAAIVFSVEFVMILGECF